MTISKADLKKWVDYAREHKAVILYDAAYEAYIREDGVPHSIYEVEGSKEVAIEFRSFSKTAGFTGTRCAFAVVPKTLYAYTAEGGVGFAEQALVQAADDQVQRRCIYHPEGGRRNLQR